MPRALDPNRVHLIARPGSALGVRKKVTGWAAALEESGHAVEVTIISGGTRSEAAAVRRAIRGSRAGTIFLRQDWMALPALPLLVRARMRGQRVVFDVPTPSSAGLREVRLTPMPARQRLIGYAFTFCNPYVRWPATRILQYGMEGRYFALGVRRRSLLVTNAVDVASVPVAAPARDGGPVRMLAVGGLKPWHGLDRLLLGLAEYRAARGAAALPVELVLVGSGTLSTRLDELIDDLGLADVVTRTGDLDGPDLDRACASAHIAVGTLAFHRTGLSLASPLKHREYAARGIPLLIGHKDPDFGRDLAWVFHAPPDDEPIDVSALIGWRLGLGPEEALRDTIRQYAVERLDFSAHIAELLG